VSATRNIPAGRAIVAGAASGVVGTAAMDLLWYERYRREGGKDSFWKWEFGDGIKDWDEASAPGQLGRKVEGFLLRRRPPQTWARSTTNLVHWATGAGWGLQFGLIVSKASRRRWMLGLSLGPAAWLSSYVVLPLAKVYKPIWDYDPRTLEKDLSAHMVYGVATGIAFSVVTRAVASGVME
jgi:hypothetical protein